MSTNCYNCKKPISKGNLTGLCMSCKSNKLVFIKDSHAIKKYPISQEDLARSNLKYFKSKFESYYYLKDIQNLANTLTKDLGNKDPKRKKYMRQLNRFNKLNQVSKTIDTLYNSVMEDVNTLCTKLSFVEEMNIKNNEAIMDYLEGILKSCKGNIEKVPREEVTSTIYQIIENKSKVIPELKRHIEKYNETSKKYANKILKQLLPIKRCDFYMFASHNWVDWETMLYDMRDSLVSQVKDQVQRDEHIAQIKLHIPANDIKYAKKCQEYRYSSYYGHINIDNLKKQIQTMKENFD